MADDPNLVKVHVELPNHWATGGESLWAEDLGDNLYRLLNVPFHAYNLNYGDIVRAHSLDPDEIPEIESVESRSGNNTLRIVFLDDAAPEQRSQLLEHLNSLNASYEGANEAFYALDLAPEADVDAIRDILDDWEKRGLLGYETCEARAADGFDDAEHDSDESAV